MPTQNALIDTLLEIAGCKPLNESQEEWYWTYGSFDDYLVKYNLEWVLTNAKRGSVWHQFDEVSTPEEALVLINKVLDVYHQRSDLASMFITGGRNSLTKISNG